MKHLVKCNVILETLLCKVELYQSAAAAQSIFIATRERHYCSYCSPKVRDHSENVISVKLEINKVFRISRSLKQRNEMFNISNILDSALFQGDRRSGFP